MFGVGFSSGWRLGTHPVSGSASWTGVMVGRDVCSTAFVEGDATVTMDPAAARVGADFSDVAALDGNRYRDMRRAGMGVSRGRFSGSDTVGHFYGPNDEEVGGVFERDRIVGAFGAKR